MDFDEGTSSHLRSLQSIKKPKEALSQASSRVGDCLFSNLDFALKPTMSAPDSIPSPMMGLDNLMEDGQMAAIYCTTPASTEHTPSVLHRYIQRVDSVASPDPLSWPFNLEEQQIDTQSATLTNMEPLTKAVKNIFQNVEKHEFLVRPDQSSRCPSSTTLAFDASAELVRALADIQKHSNINGSVTYQLDDSELVMVASCFLKVITRYDDLFSCWLVILQYTEDELRSSDASRERILELLPPVFVGPFLASTCYMAQLHLIIDISSNLYRDMSQTLDSIARMIGERDRMTSEGKITYVSETMFQLVMSKERVVKSKKDNLLSMMGEEKVMQRLEEILYPTQDKR
jgi:hypothetical protein